MLFYGKGGDIATSRPEEQELSVACLLVLQAAVAYVNRLLVQDILAEPAWADARTGEPARADAAVWTHVAPYGEVKLDLARRLVLRGEASPGREAGRARSGGGLDGPASSGKQADAA